jgi:hypothetical protein
MCEDGTVCSGVWWFAVQCSAVVWCGEVGAAHTFNNEWAGAVRYGGQEIFSDRIILPHITSQEPHYQISHPSDMVTASWASYAIFTHMCRLVWYDHLPV